MAILGFNGSQAGLIGVVPTIVSVLSNDTLETVVNTPGYLNAYVNQVSAYESALVYTTDEGSVLLTINYVDGNIGLKAQTAGGVVQIPTTIGHIAVYDNTNGGQSEDAPTAINAGNIQAGVSGVQGYFISYPPTAAKGTFTFEAANNVNDYGIILTNGSHAQASTYTILDSGAVSSSFITSNSLSTQTIATGSLALSAGNLTLGSNGNASILTLYPAGSGTFIITATSNVSGSFYTQLTTDAAVGQNQVITIPDGGTALSNILLTNSSGIQTIATGSLALTLGNLTLGSNGHASILTIFPASATTGTLILEATSSSGPYNTTITNALLAQSTVFTIPDPHVSAANFILSDSNSTQTISTGNLFLETGVLTLGSNEHASSLTIYPAGNALGTLVIQATNNTGNTATTITNVAMGQATELFLSDPVNAQGQILVAAGTTPFTGGHLLKAASSLGVVQDAGYYLTAGTSTSLGIADVVEFVATNVLSSSSIVTISILELTTPGAVIVGMAIAAGSITVTFTEPPGVVTISYISLNTA